MRLKPFDPVYELPNPGKRDSAIISARICVIRTQNVYGRLALLPIHGYRPTHGNDRHASSVVRFKAESYCRKHLRSTSRKRLYNICVQLSYELSSRTNITCSSRRPLPDKYFITTGTATGTMIGINNIYSTKKLQVYNFNQTILLFERVVSFVTARNCLSVLNRLASNCRIW